MSSLSQKLFAEAIGTFMLVAAVVGAALVSGNAAGLGVALAIGFAVMAMAYAVGGISGGHFNPAVTLGLAAARRFPNNLILPYWAAQIVGGILAALFFFIVYKFKGGDLPTGFASNGYGEHSGGGFPLSSAFLMELVQTALFIFVMARVTRADSGAGNMAPVAIGLTLAAMHIMSIPAANTSLNPARSIATAVIEQGWALNQLWLFILAPLAGGVIGGLLDKVFENRV
jgi:aquaporin Z